MRARRIRPLHTSRRIAFCGVARRSGFVGEDVRTVRSSVSRQKGCLLVATPGRFNANRAAVLPLPHQRAVQFAANQALQRAAVKTQFPFSILTFFFSLSVCLIFLMRLVLFSAPPVTDAAERDFADKSNRKCTPSTHTHTHTNTHC